VPARREIGPVVLQRGTGVPVENGLSPSLGEELIRAALRTPLAPCRHGRARPGKVVFVGVDVNDFGSDAHRFLERHHVNYVSLRARGSSLYDAYGLIGLPETYYLDRRGRVVAQTVGELSPQKLAAGIARAEGG